MTEPPARPWLKAYAPGIVWDAVARQFPGVTDARAPEFKGVKEQVMIGVVKRSR